MTPVYVPRNPHEKAMQRALIQYKNPNNYDLVYEALEKAGRLDLVGYGPECLIKPMKPKLPGKGGKPASKSGQKPAQRNNQGSGNKKSYRQGKNKAANYKKK